jgi:hypothetical protein
MRRILPGLEPRKREDYILARDTKYIQSKGRVCGGDRRGDTAVMLKSPEHPEMIPVARRSLSRYAGELVVTTQCRSERT